MEVVSYVGTEDKKVNGLFPYASHNRVVRTFQPHFCKAGVFVATTVKNHVREGNLTSVTLKIKFVNIDAPEDFVEIEAVGQAVDAGDKGPGKAVSYAFKYGLLKMFCVETKEDTDDDASPQEHTCLDADETKQLLLNQVNMLLKMCRCDVRETHEKLAKEQKVASLQEVGVDSLKNIISRLEKRVSLMEEKEKKEKEKKEKEEEEKLPTQEAESECG